MTPEAEDGNWNMEIELEKLEHVNWNREIGTGKLGI